MILSKSQHEKNFKGFITIGCAARSKDIFYFSLIQDEATLLPAIEDDEGTGDIEDRNDSLTRRIVYFIRSMPEKDRWGHGEFPNSDSYRLSVARSPLEQLVAVDLGGQVFVSGSGASEMETKIAGWRENGIRRGGIDRCRTIGRHVYVAGAGRSVGFRQERNKWISLTQGLPFDYEKDWENAGFIDIDGFGANDIYCVGGQGDVWHFDGMKWEQIHFPSNMHLYSVCCAGDGEVYISGYQGTTFRGRGQKWKQIYKGEMAIPFRDMVWHQDRVWCTSDYGLWTIKDGKLKDAAVDDQTNICAGNLSSCSEVLLLAGHSGAAYYKGCVWNKIF